MWTVRLRPRHAAAEASAQTQMERLCLEGFLEEWSKTDGGSRMLGTHLSLALSHGLNRLTRLLVRYSANVRVSTLCQALGIQQRKHPPAWNLGSSGGQDDGGGGDRQRKGTCDVHCGKTAKQGKWVLEHREGIPIIVHIYAREIYRIQANCQGPVLSNAPLWWPAAKGRPEGG